MHLFDAPPPGLEQGLCPLDRLGRPVPLGDDNPYPLLRVLLSLAMEQSGVGLYGQFLCSCQDQDLRRDAALIRRVEGRQAASLTAWLSLPGGPEEKCLFYALLSLELSAALAQRMEKGPVRQALHFFIPEYLDQLYRIANLLALDGGAPAQHLLAGYAEIMPGRPLIACHRHPHDGIGAFRRQSPLWEEMSLRLLLAAEEAFRGFLLFACGGASAAARELFLEMSLLSEARCASLLSLLPPAPGLTGLWMHHYAECYLYDSGVQLAPNENLKALMAEERDHECAHLHKLLSWLSREKKDPFVPKAFPPPLSLGPNKGYVRDTLQHIGVTAFRDDYRPVGALPGGADFFRYQRRVCPADSRVPSQRIVAALIEKTGSDYRFEIAPHPVEALRDRARLPARLGR